LSSPERAPAGADVLQVKLVQGIGQIDARTWDACVGPDQPFLRHAFLSALEDSGSASQRTGWLPLHLVAESGGELIGCAPMYLKSHSYGEYVFDWGWANAYERAGGTYYPKLQVAVPFTPVPGPRLLVRPGQGGTARVTLAHGLVSAAEQLGVSSLHVTFCREDEWHELGAAGLLKRQGVQYHWHNRGYRDFDDFLASLKHSRRKTIRKERARVTEQGLSIEVLTGDALTPDIWDAFYPFYRSTVDKRWGGAYLSKRFFTRLGETMPEQVLLVLARHEGRYIAGALNLIGEDTLYGRVWGCRRQFEFLHFEACYYRAIEFAIERGLARVQAGAQGPHKLQRGYEPVPTYSAHWIRDPGFRAAVERFLAQERAEMACEMEELRNLLPYRQDNTSSVGECPREP
jgi:predicted N-acyltransferase